MKKFFGIFLLSATILPASGQRVLTLDSCRQMALRNNKQLGVSKLKQDVAENLRKSARTKYLPHVSAIGTYEHTSEEVSIYLFLMMARRQHCRIWAQPLDKQCRQSSDQPLRSFSPKPSNC